MPIQDVSVLPVLGNADATKNRVRSKSFNQLLPIWAAEIRARARRRATSWCSVQDLEQAGLIALWKATRSFRADRGVFDHYVRRAVRNAMEAARHRAAPLAKLRPEFIRLDDKTLTNVSYSIDSLDSTYDVAQWLHTLPQTFTVVFDLLYRQGFTQTEAAAIMGITQGRVSQLHAELLARGRVELIELVA